MDFSLPPELQELQQRTRAFIRDKILPLEGDKRQTHHGPTEDVPAGYLAFLLELRSTPRITEFAKKYASIMTGTYEKFRRDQY